MATPIPTVLPQIGSRVVVVPSGHETASPATVRYVGPLHQAAPQAAAPGRIVVGLEWDHPGCGKHDGMVAGHRYFRCRPGHGSLVDPRKLVPSQSQSRPGSKAEAGIVGIGLWAAIVDKYQPAEAATVGSASGSAVPGSFGSSRSQQAGADEYQGGESSSCSASSIGGSNKDHHKTNENTGDSEHTNDTAGDNGSNIGNTGNVIYVAETALRHQVALQFVGERSAIHRMGRLSGLRQLSLAGMNVTRIEPDLRLSRVCPRLESLDLARNLLCCWGQVLQILRTAPASLRTLILSGNPLLTACSCVYAMPGEPAKPRYWLVNDVRDDEGDVQAAAGHESSQHHSLNHPSHRSHSVCPLVDPVHQADHEGPLESGLVTLVLNFIPGVWPNFLRFLATGKLVLPRLREVFAAHTHGQGNHGQNNLEPSSGQSCSEQPPGEAVTPFSTDPELVRQLPQLLPALEQLDLSHNRIADWSGQVLPLLRALPHLKTLQLAGNDLESLETAHQQQQQQPHGHIAPEEKEQEQSVESSSTTLQSAQQQDEPPEIFAGLRTLLLSDNRLYAVSQLDRLRAVFPCLESVTLSRNPLDWSAYLQGSEDASESPSAYSSVPGAAGDNANASVSDGQQSAQVDPQRLIHQLITQPDHPSDLPAHAVSTSSLNDADFASLVPEPRSSRELVDAALANTDEEAVRLLEIAVMPPGLKSLNRSRVEAPEKSQARRYFLNRVWRMEEARLETRLERLQEQLRRQEQQEQQQQQEKSDAQNAHQPLSEESSESIEALMMIRTPEQASRRILDACGTRHDHFHVLAAAEQFQPPPIRIVLMTFPDPSASSSSSSPSPSGPSSSSSSSSVASSSSAASSTVLAAIRARKGRRGLLAGSLLPIRLQLLVFDAESDAEDIFQAVVAAETLKSLSPGLDVAKLRSLLQRSFRKELPKAAGKGAQVMGMRLIVPSVQFGDGEGVGGDLGDHGASGGGDAAQQLVVTELEDDLRSLGDYELAEEGVRLALVVVRE